MYERASQGDNADPLGERVVELLAAGRAGLVTDIDGTIAQIVPRPEMASVLPTAREALEGLKQHVALVGVVTGRGVADAMQLVGVEGLAYVGNHGLEVLSANGPELLPEARPWIPRVAAVLEEIARELPQPGIIIENKGATASLHYRLAPDPDAARRDLLAMLARCTLTSGLRLEEGRMVLNLLPPLTVTKGSAVTWLMREHGLRRMVYLGDDITDVHAFKALSVMRQADGVKTLSIGVVGRDTHASVRQHADTSVPSVEAAADLLCGVLQSLRARRSQPESGAGADATAALRATAS